MNLKQVITEINKRCGADFSDFNDRAKTYFITSIADLVNTNNYDKNDLRQIINTIKTDIAFDIQQIFSININNNIKEIINVKVSDLVYKEDKNHYLISIIDENKIEFIKKLKQKSNQYFVYHTGKNIIIYSENPDRVDIVIDYLYLPNINSWRDDQDLSLFSNKFLFDCIALATEKLLTEQSR